MAIDALAELTELGRLADWEVAPVDVEERLAIIDQAQVLLRDYYVHLAHKRALYGIDPLRQLQRLRDRVAARDADSPSEPEFHRRMTGIFTSLRDHHTQYLLPASHRGHVAYLPFLVERCIDDSRLAEPRELYVVSRLHGEAPAGFESGIEVVSWNGVPIAAEIELAAERNAGANRAAREALALSRLTYRALRYGERPPEHRVRVGFLTASGKLEEAAFDWCVGRLGEPVGDSEDCRARVALRSGLDGASEQRRLAKAARSSGSTGKRRARSPHGDKVQFNADFDDGYGVLRIYSFAVDDAADFVDAIRELLADAPPKGVIIDVRGNPGGNLEAAARLLELFTATPLRRQPYQLAYTPATRALIRHHPDFNQWRGSLPSAEATAEPYSFPAALSRRGGEKEFGQCYQGAVALIVDALSYSATDMFAAAFQDHGIGPVIGTSARTGAGGANAWTHACLLAAMEDAGVREDEHGLRTLESRASFTVALRRCFRGGGDGRLGAPLEDFGVTPDAPGYTLTRHDVVTGKRYYLLVHARQVLEDWRACRALRELSVSLDGGDLVVSTRTLDRVDVFVDGRPWTSVEARDDETQRLPLDERAAGRAEARVLGLYGDDVYLERRVRLAE